ncbi:MAG: coproporphyrinogen III oxidase, partial [Acidobacteria bacterium]|nr:coproporphyrinogen III oxidase [Acidobacteriota bacterium]
AETGYLQYEISNFSKPGFESRHNVKYWRMEPVFGFGMSAHSFDGRERYANTRSTDEFIRLVETRESPEIMRETIDLASETAFLGLRLEMGIELDGYRRSFGSDIFDSYGERLVELIDAGLLERGDSRLRLTRKGKLLSNEVFAVFV